MKTFTINPKSWSYRLLCLIFPNYRFHRTYCTMTPEQIRAKQNHTCDFRWYRGHDVVARDFCSYWRWVSFALALIIVGSYVAFATVAFWFHLSWWNVKILPVFDALMMAIGLLANVGIAAGAAFFFCKWAVPHVARAYGAFLDWKHRNDSDEEIAEAKPHPIRDTCRTAYAAYKHKFCPMVAYTNEVSEDAAPSESN